MYHFSKISIAALTIALASQASAQNASPELNGDANGVAEIVVTAQKRSESIQDVPISITAVSAAFLRERAIGDVSQLSNSAPNVSLDAGTPFSGSSSILAAYIRGIGANDFAINLDPGVGVYLDGVYLARTVGANLDLPDVERIEILKGPQGTLFGRNTIGGAISVVTRDPADSFGFRGDVTTGRYRRLDVRGSVDLPFTDRLGALMTFSTKNRGGYQKLIPYPGIGQYRTEALTAFQHTGYKAGDDAGDQDEWTLRGKLVWEPVDRLKVRLAGDYMRSDQAALPNSVLAVTSAVPGAFAGTSNIPGTALDPTGTTGFGFAGLYNFCIGSTPADIAARNAQNLCGARGTPLNPTNVLPGLAGANVDNDPANNRLPYDNRWISAKRDQSYATGINFSKMRTWSLAGTLEYDLADHLQLKSITGYRNLHWRSGVDLDNSPLQILENSFSMNQWQLSQEVQALGSLLDNKLNYVLGGYYFKEKGSVADYVTFGEGLLQFVGPVDLKTTNYAVFGQVDWRATQLLGVTVGGRYTHERKALSSASSDVNGFNYKLFNCTVYGDPCSSALGFPDAQQPFRYYVTGINRQKFSNFAPKVGVQLHPSEDIMAYGSWSRGYKSGGWTTRITNPLPFAPEFAEEEAETWEAGLKTTLLDRRLQLNAAVFTTKYDGIQLNFQQGVSPTIRNAGDARIKGAEVEAIIAPARGLTINAAAGYIEAKYTSVEPGASVLPNAFQAGVFKGAALPRAPKWKLSVAPRYAVELGKAGSLIMLADYSWTSRQWNDTERTVLLRRKPVDMLNASLTYRAPSKAWDFTVGGTNLLNERYIASGLSQVVGGGIFGTWNRPTEWYARLAVNF